MKERAPICINGSNKVELDGTLRQSWFACRTMIINLLLQLNISIHVVGHCGGWIFEDAVEFSLCLLTFDVRHGTKFSSKCNPNGRGRFEMSDTGEGDSIEAGEKSL